jgi:hypothetical protein
MIMKRIIQSMYFSLAMLTLLLNGCAPALTPPPLTFTPLPTNTSLPTNTPLPTKKPTSVPTATVPAPEKVLEYLNGVEVVHVDTFDEKLSRATWSFGTGFNITEDGVLEVQGKDWNNISPIHGFKEGSGVVVDFIYSKGAFFEAYVAKGIWDTVGYKTFGVYFYKNSARTNAWADKNDLGGEYVNGNFALHPDTYYSLLMAVMPDGEFLVTIWKPTDPTKTLYYREKIGRSWSDLSWTFGIAVDEGTLTLDNYREIKFNNAN